MTGRQHPFFMQTGCSLYFSNMASGTGSSGMLLMEDAFLRCSNLTLPFLIHQSPEIVLYQVFTTQSGDIGERQTGEAREDKDIPDQFKPWNGEFLFITVCNSS